MTPQWVFQVPGPHSAAFARDREPELPSSSVCGTGPPPCLPGVNWPRELIPLQPPLLWFALETLTSISLEIARRTECPGRTLHWGIGGETLPPLYTHPRAGTGTRRCSRMSPGATRQELTLRGAPAAGAGSENKWRAAFSLEEWPCQAQTLTLRV